MTTTVLRPSADSYRSNVTLSTGSTMFSLVDDSPDDDATYFRAPPLIYSTQAYAVLNWPDTVTLTATQRIRAVRLRSRLRLHAFSNGYGAKVAYALRDGRNGKRGPQEEFFTGSTVAREFAGTWQTKPPPSWGQTTWTAYILTLTQSDVIWYRAAGSTGEQLRVSELYMDVDIRDQPVVSAVTAAGYTTSTRPTVSWTYTPDADNDLEIAYQVKVFSSTQYGLAGFNPDTSLSTWDSGQVSGNSVAATVGKDLLNGATYKIYVRAAASFNGSRWWSAWDLTSAFTVGLTSFSAPTLTVVGDNTVPWLRNVLTLVGNQNMLTDDEASMETTIGTWQNIGNATVVRSNTFAAYGAWSLRLTSVAGGDMTVKTADAGYRVEGGVSYTFLAQFRTAVSARSCQVGVAWYDRTGAIIGAAAFGSSVTDSSANFNAQATLTAAAPANAVWASMRARVLATGAASEVHYIDKVSMSPSSSTTWMPGGYLGTAYTLVERMVATSTQRNMAPAQLASGGDLYRTADGFQASGSLSRTAYDRSTRYQGEGCIRWEVLDTTSKLYVGYPSAAIANADQPYAIPAVSGRQVTFGLRAKASATFSSQLNLQCLDKDGANVGAATNGGGISITTSFQSFTATITPGAGTVYVRPHLDNTASVVDVAVFVDWCVYQLGATVDATPAPAGPNLPAWEPVRGADSGELVVPSDPGDQVITLFDNEVPPGCVVYYRARSIVDETTLAPALSSDLTPYVSTMLDPPGQGIWVLRDPEVATNTIRVHTVNMSESIHEEAGVAYPARPFTWDGQSQRAVVNSDFIGGHDGSMEIWCDSEEEWTMLKRLLSTQRTLWLIFPTGGGRWVRLLGDRTWTRESPRTMTGTVSYWRRPITVPFVEHDRPA